MTYDTIDASRIFQCKKCGECCQGYGGTYLTDRDITAIAEYIHTDPQRFVEDYCQMSGTRPIIKQDRSGYCVFWDKLCTIHPVKPRMCREWPFIKPVLTDVRNWEIMAGSCPGIRTDFPDAVIQSIVRDQLCKEE